MGIFKVMVAVAVSTALVGAAATPLGAEAPPVDRYEAMATAADERGYIIVSSEDSVRGEDESVFFPTGPISEGTLVVVALPDGSLPGGLTVAKLDQLVAEKRSRNSLQGGGGGGTLLSNFPYAYAATSTGMSSAYTGQSLIGADPTAVASYVFNAQINSTQLNAGQGLGYYRGYNGSVFGTWQAWYNLGTGSADQVGGGTAPWGEVAAVEKFRARCVTTTVCNGGFT